MPTNILSTVAIVVDFPYQTPTRIETRPGDYLITDPNVLVHELKLCEELLEMEPAECVHFDLTLGGINLLDITDEYLFRAALSPTGRSVLHAILPDLRETALSIGQKYQAPVYAMGKRSMPVRLAELYASAYGVARAIQIAKESEKTIYVGLPAKVLASFDEAGKVKVTSDEPMEKSLVAEAPIPENLSVKLRDSLLPSSFTKVTPETYGVLVEPFLNPVTRGFQALKLTAKTE